MDGVISKEKCTSEMNCTPFQSEADFFEGFEIDTQGFVLLKAPKSSVTDASLFGEPVESSSLLSE